MTDREQAIKTLEDIIAMSDKFKEKGIWTGIFTVNRDTIESLKFALESIKVDRAYDLAYEKVDFIEIPEGATNGDMIKAMFPDAEVIAVENEEMEIVEYVVKIDDETVFTADWWNSPYRKE